LAAGGGAQGAALNGWLDEACGAAYMTGV